MLHEHGKPAMISTEKPSKEVKGGPAHATLSSPLRAFERAFSVLHIQVMEMGGLVFDQVREALHAYLEWDPRRAQRVIERAGAIHEYERRIHEAHLVLLIRHQPLASDLRVLFDLGLAAAELVHAGAEGRKIAHLVSELQGQPRPAQFMALRRFGSDTLALLRRSLDALDDLDSEPSSPTIERPTAADRVGLLEILTARAIRVPAEMRAAIDAASVLASLEAVIDHAGTLLGLRQRRGRPS